MPTKKRGIADDEEASSAHASPVTTNKRPRTGPMGDENGHPKNRRKGKARAIDEEQMDEEEDEEEGEDVDVARDAENQEELDKQFEAQHYDKIMASVKSRDKYRGVSATSFN